MLHLYELNVSLCGACNSIHFIWIYTRAAYNSNIAVDLKSTLVRTGDSRRHLTSFSSNNIVQQPPPILDVTILAIDTNLPVAGSKTKHTWIQLCHPERTRSGIWDCWHSLSSVLQANYLNLEYDKLYSYIYVGSQYWLWTINRVWVATERPGSINFSMTFSVQYKSMSSQTAE